MPNNRRAIAPTAKEINDAHRLARTSAETAIEHAIRCGQMLVKLKGSLEHGEFQGWVEKHCEFSDRQARRYMQAAAKTDTRVRFDSLRQLLGVETKPAKKQEKSDTTARGARSEVMNPPESAARGSEAGNLIMDHGENAGPVRPPAPASAQSTQPEEPECPDWEPDEDEKLAAIERVVQESRDKYLAADDRLAAADAEVQRQAAEIISLKISRDGYMGGKNAVLDLLKKEQRKSARLEKELKKALEENEKLRERIAIMEAA